MASKKLNANVNVDGVMYGPDYPENKVTSEVADAIENPNVWGDPDDGGDAASYDDMKVGELKAEIAERNDGRDPEGDGYISSEGNKAALVAALEADDAAASA